MAGMRVYSVPAAAEAETAAIDLFELVAPSLGSIELVGLQVSQTTEEGDAQDEMIQISITQHFGAFTGGSGGSSVTPTPVDPDDVAASFTAEKSNTTQITGGTSAVVVYDAFNVRAGYLWVPLECQRIRVGPTDAIVVALEAPADSVSWTGTAWVNEIGT